MVVVDKERICKIIDFAVPGEKRIEQKEKDKIEKYQDLGRALQKIWNVRVKIIPLVVDSNTGVFLWNLTNILEQWWLLLKTHNIVM